MSQQDTPFDGLVLPDARRHERIRRSSKAFPQSMEHFERVSVAAENAGFDYMLVPGLAAVLGRVGRGLVHAEPHHEAEGAGRDQARLHPSGRAGQDDLDLRPAVGAAAST